MNPLNSIINFTDHLFKKTKEYLAVVHDEYDSESESSIGLGSSSSSLSQSSDAECVSIETSQLKEQL